MRLVDLVIDLAAVFKASQSVASKHVALRSRQLDAYNRSSSVAAALRRAQPSTVTQNAPKQGHAADARAPAPMRADAVTFTPTATAEHDISSRHEEQIELPSFVRRSARPKPPADILRQLRQKEYNRPNGQSSTPCDAAASASSISIGSLRETLPVRCLADARCERFEML